MMTVVLPPPAISRARTLGTRARTSALVALVCLGVAACGSSGGGSSSPFDLPEVVSSGGPVLDAPRVQPIYFPGYTFQTDIDTFLAKMASSTYWPTVVGEYGVGDLTIKPSVLTTVSSGDSITDTDIPGLLARVFTSDGAALGAPSRDTIYLLLFPSSTRITAQGQLMCGDGAASGYHTEYTIGGVNVPGIVVPSCPDYAGDKTLTGAQALTPTISHEIVEAATDPFTTSSPAYFDVDQRHAYWSVAINGGEVADLCENETPDLITPDDIGYPVQRIWSNAAVKAGTGPCVPVPPGELFFIGIPSLPSTVLVTRGGEQFSVPALYAPVGAAATVNVTLKSENNGVASWSVGALEIHSDNPSVPSPTLVPGQTGQTVRSTVAPNEVATGLSALIIASVNKTAVHFWIGAIVRR